MMAPDVMRRVVRYIREHGPDEAPLVVVHCDLPSGKLSDNLSVVQAYASAPVTRWLENINLGRGAVNKMGERIRSGPLRK